MESIFATVAHANNCTGFCFVANYGTFATFLEAMISALIMILTPIIVLMIVYTGFLFVKAQGNPAELERARTALLWTVIGGAVIIASLALSKALGAFITSL